jgi:hypothetical protein
MSISSVSSMTNIYPMYQLDQTSAQHKAGQFRQEFNALASALQSGDLSGAQQAFAALQKLLPSSSAGNQTQTGQQGSGQNTFATDFNALGQALQSNDLQKAQEAFAKLQQDIQSVQGRHHHHHHHDASASTQSIAPTTSNASVASDAGAGGDGSGSGSINVVAWSLNSAGDTNTYGRTFDIGWLHRNAVDIGYPQKNLFVKTKANLQTVED